MSSTVVKRSIVVAGHRTSISLEVAFWKALKTIARQRGDTLSGLVAAIDDGRQDGNVGGNLSSAIRVFVLEHYRR
jgi:predicted DNA-binding ribbon-helix-helix protein